MDGRVKSRGRRSLVKRHRGSRLSVPVPAARRQRVESSLWAACSFARPAGAWRTLAGVRARSISNGGSTPGHDLP